MREIGSKETYRLYDCMEDLAKHHNEVSVYFKGGYPTISSEEILRKFAEDLENGISRIAVMEDGDKVIGFCKINIVKDNGFLDYLSVLEEERGKGLGSVLVDWALEKFAEYNVRNIEVKVVYGNGVIDFYKKYGFREKSILMSLKR
ncbi:MAG: GNAT family N-acetyltransferase [Lachnospiraceae bacterium]|nr:GNAT family N-acetyltransferase [Lachnospiraceae bacterium]